LGFIQLSSNFSQSLPLFNDDGIELDFSDDGVIQVYLDKSNLQITSFIEQKLFDAYRNFTESLMTSCGKSKKAGNVPIVIEAEFGDIKFDIRTTMISAFLLA
jgi:hypothetical protein